MDEDWTPLLAEDVASVYGVKLAEKHWRAIVSARELIARTGRVPSIEEIGRACECSVADMKRLFPGGVERLLARVAGAPELERNQR